jgi:putative ABC transport system permease protein
MALMCREFLLLIGLANLIAWPVAYFAIKDWLDNFAYRTQIPAVFFIGALATSLAIGLMTVIYKAIRAASANPVEALKHE